MSVIFNVQCTKKVLVEFVDNAGPDQPAQSGPSLSAYRINGYCSICQQTEFYPSFF